MEVVNPMIEVYLEETLVDADPILKEMHRKAGDEDFPIVGPIVGRFLATLTHIGRARRIFEFGSGFGYSAYWFARAAGHNAHVVHVDNSPIRSAEAKDFITRGKLHDRVVFEVGDALEIFPTHDGLWDIVFLDLDKQNYTAALKLAWPRVRPGGMLIADNVLWSGKVMTGDASPETRGIKDFTEALLALPDGFTSILPVRDGVSVTWKEKEL